MAEGHAARDDGDLVEGHSVLGEESHQGVAGLMVRCHLVRLIILNLCLLGRSCQTHTHTHIFLFIFLKIKFTGEYLSTVKWQRSMLPTSLSLQVLSYIYIYIYFFFIFLFFYFFYLFVIFFVLFYYFLLRFFFKKKITGK